MVAEGVHQHLTAWAADVDSKWNDGGAKESLKEDLVGVRLVALVGSVAAVPKNAAVGVGCGEDAWYTGSDLVCKIGRIVLARAWGFARNRSSAIHVEGKTYDGQGSALQNSRRRGVKCRQ